MKDKIYTEVYAITFTENKAILTEDSLKKYWPNYGKNGLHGWRPPKRLYFTLGMAKSAFRKLPAELQKQLCISKFTFFSIEANSDELIKEYNVKLLKKHESDKKKNALKNQLEHELRILKDRLNKLR
jgi:hypothetical protein